VKKGGASEEGGVGVRHGVVLISGREKADLALFI
jgi:hypothetical protein